MLVGGSGAFRPEQQRIAIGKAWRPALFGVWLALVAIMAARHVLWRDEVRALTLALSGNNLAGMAHAVHGEGHPLLWYVLLRVAHEAWSSVAVLPALGLAVGVAGAALLVFRAPFGPWLMGMILAGRMMLFEYSVMARNYGIAMLAMFALAMAYPRYRQGGLVPGVLLFLLANTNVHSVILVVAFLLFWLADLVMEHGLAPSRALGNWALNAALAALGIVICLATVYPPFNDAAGGHVQIGAYALSRALVFQGVLSSHLNIALQLALAGALIGALRWPPVALSLLAAALGFSLFFNAVYPGDYRHRALFLAFAITLTWIAMARGKPAWPIDAALPASMRNALLRAQAWARTRLVTRAAWFCCAIILLFNVGEGFDSVAAALANGAPRSQSAAFARFVAARPDLRDATIIADPDYLVEPLPYYLDNPLYLQREHRFGSYVIFSRQAQRSLSLGQMLDNAHRLAATRQRPVILLLAAPLDPEAPPRGIAESYNWTFQTDAAQIARLHRETGLLGHFGPAETDETFDAFLLRPAAQ